MTPGAFDPADRSAKGRDAIAVSCVGFEDAVAVHPSMIGGGHP
jgi:hypothetical protein